jgi:hypothetical protein
LLEVVEVSKISRVGGDGLTEVDVGSYFLSNFLCVTKSLVVNSLREKLVEIKFVFHQEADVAGLKYNVLLPKISE